MTDVNNDKDIETQYLLDIPGMKESIIEGLNTPIEECLMEMDFTIQQ